ncbi:unnamed protein product [Hydatigera taeniaeformis]|uniref:DUF5727 domain-containing protein n=1 Tax=Hydatigena taeniaeformis TaxID=6205 RepID=A0A0R3WUQ4_HYDTA|nr:unnamed protein product [Hydatigera taeniaeformis]
MIEYAFLLTLIAFCSAGTCLCLYFFLKADPVLWGSRVVAVSNGTTPTMYFRFPNGSAIELQIGDSAAHALEIRDNKCYANQKMVGEPCELSEVRSVSARRQRPEDLILSWLTFSSCVHVVGSANITLFKIDRDSLLQVKKGKLPFSTTYLIPDCTLPDYGPEYLVRDENSGVTKFLGNFPRNKSEENTAYQWCRPTQCLVVTVDWTQGGESLATLRRQAYFPLFSLSSSTAIT